MNIICLFALHTEIFFNILNGNVLRYSNHVNNNASYNYHIHLKHWLLKNDVKVFWNRDIFEIYSLITVVVYSNNEVVLQLFDMLYLISFIMQK